MEQLITSLISSEIPQCVQAVIIGGPNDNEQPRCTGCRVHDKVFRCARCQVAHYCSQACQKKHFAFHKKLCKQVSTLRGTVEQEWGHHDVTDSQNSLIDSLSDLITTFIVMGYRETDTVNNGRFYYRKALQYSVVLARLCNTRNDESCHDDLVLLLLGILGASPSTIWAWCTETQSPRQNYFTTELEQWDAASNVFTTPHALSSDDFNFHMVGLLVLMRVLANQRQQQQQQQTDALDNVTVVVPQQIELLLSSLKAHNHIQALIHLRDTIPFSPLHAPKLASSDKVPEEIWYLYQDCFFTTPGVNNILHEFIPEDDDPIDRD